MISLPGRTAAQIFCCIWNVLWLWLMSLTAGSSASGLARSLHSVRSTWWAFHDKRHKTTQGGISKPPWTHASHCAHSFGHTQGSGTFFFFFWWEEGYLAYLGHFSLVLKLYSLTENVFCYVTSQFLCHLLLKGKWSDRTDLCMDYIVLANSIGFHSGNWILPVEVRQFLDVDSTDSAQDVVTKRNQTFAA